MPRTRMRKGLREHYGTEARRTPRTDLIRALPELRFGAYRKIILCALEVFDVSTGLTSRYQYWKYQVSPA